MHATVAATAVDSNGFAELGLNESVVQALRDVGYEAPTPIQAATIPAILAGSDVLGQAQTGTGKTGAFALPVLSKIDLTKPKTQAMVLVPTRELAIQVAEAFQRYATHMPGFHVLPIYGGQSYTPQLKGLKRGAHVIVGTPGRVMDHIKRGTLPLDALSFLVLDEADEMLQMGFIDAIEWILEQLPPARQIALFSATVPPAIRRIAQRHQRAPQEITIRSKTSTAPNIRQRYWLVSGMHKLDALTRILEVESFDAMLVFVRTKLETVELAERLEARGFEAAALNGDIPQQQRERTVAALKSGKVDIVVATDVAARGLDVERISHVVNYDVPYDSESYIHRIGRTGRAGRSGEAILFIAPRERNMLRIIERATRQQITQMNLPSVAAVNEQRVARFKQRIAATLADGEVEAFRAIIEEFQAEHDVSAVDVAAALASLLQGSTPLLLPEKSESEQSSRGWERRDEQRDAPRHRGALSGFDRSHAGSGESRGHRGDRERGPNQAARNDRSVQGDRAPRSDRGAQWGGGSQGVDRNARSDRNTPVDYSAQQERVRNERKSLSNGTAPIDRSVPGVSNAQGNRDAPNDQGVHGDRQPQSHNAGVMVDHIAVGDNSTQSDRSSPIDHGAEGDRRAQNERSLSVDDGVADVSNAQDNRVASSNHEAQGVAVAGDVRSDHDMSVEHGIAGDSSAQSDRDGTFDHGVEGDRRAENQRGVSIENGAEGIHGTRDDRGVESIRTGQNDRGAQTDRPGQGERRARRDRGAPGERSVGAPAERSTGAPADSAAGRPARRKRDDANEIVFETFRLEVGHAHGVKPGNIVGAIANEAGLEGRYIGHVDIRDNHSFVDLPEGMPRDIFRNLKKVRVAGQELRISRIDGKAPPRQH